MSIADRLHELGLALPSPTTAVGSYSTAVQSGQLVFLSGHICKRDGQVVRGKVGVGGDHTEIEAQQLAALCALDLLATLDAAVGLDQVARVVKLVGFVNSTDSFTDQSIVLNGASDLLVSIFGEDRGRHARSAVGVNQLPMGASVEVEAIVEVA